MPKIKLPAGIYVHQQGNDQMDEEGKPFELKCYWSTRTKSEKCHCLLDWALFNLSSLIQCYKKKMPSAI